MKQKKLIVKVTSKEGVVIYENENIALQLLQSLIMLFDAADNHIDIDVVEFEIPVQGVS